MWPARWGSPTPYLPLSPVLTPQLSPGAPAPGPTLSGDSLCRPALHSGRSQQGVGGRLLPVGLRPGVTPNPCPHHILPICSPTTSCGLSGLGAYLPSRLRRAPWGRGLVEGGAAGSTQPGGFRQPGRSQERSGPAKGPGRPPTPAPHRLLGANHVPPDAQAHGRTGPLSACDI